MSTKAVVLAAPALSVARIPNVNVPLTVGEPVIEVLSLLT